MSILVWKDSPDDPRRSGIYTGRAGGMRGSYAVIVGRDHVKTMFTTNGMTSSCIGIASTVTEGKEIAQRHFNEARQ